MQAGDKSQENAGSMIAFIGTSETGKQSSISCSNRFLNGKTIKKKKKSNGMVIIKVNVVVLSGARQGVPSGGVWTVFWFLNGMVRSHTHGVPAHPFM